MGPNAPRGCGSDFRASLDNVPATFLFYPIAAAKYYAVCQKTCSRRLSGTRLGAVQERLIETPA